MQVLRQFIDKHRDTHGVEPICKVLQIAPSGYRRHATQQRNSDLRCVRAKTDDTLKPEIQRVWQANMRVYGADKVWKQMNREGMAVARCTVERLMRSLGLRGVRRGKVVRTTIGDMSAAPPTGSGQSAIQDRSSQSALGVGLHVCLDLAGLAIRGLFD